MLVSGRILSVQEQRFRVRADDGRVLLLRLSHSADAEDLHTLQEQQVRVNVEYKGAPNLASGVASSVHKAG